MSARERILERVVAARAGAGDPSTVEKYLQQHPRGPAPSLGPDLAQQFCERATQLASEVVRVVAISDVPIAVARYLESNKLSRRAVCWPELVALPWHAQHLEVEACIATGNDLVGITGAFAGIAETGTLMLLSGANTPATVSLLPETHIAVVQVGCIVATMEDVWARMRAQWGAIPRAVNFVSGPSRTADVEQTVTLGAHGPRRALIVLVGD
jgi:L-lactate dehydrogenase complex protein LldG